nr:NACHT domain-containing protein [Micromonospora sp. DSM 115978]
MTRGTGQGPEATVLHISDTQFGRYHRFSGDDRSLAAHLLADLRSLLDGDLSEVDIPGIDLIVLSGDLTEQAVRSEFDQARAFIDQLCVRTGLDYRRVVVVPGNHDVSWALSESYFAECRAEETEPKPPYARKWRHYQRFVTGLHGETAFTEEQPYRVHRFDELGVVVAALNSTMRESHAEHHGWCGTEQLRWAAEQLRACDGLLRVGVLHHNVRRGEVADNENLRDSVALTTALGPYLDLLLHGHTHNGAEDRLADGTLVLATGSAAVSADWRPAEVPNQYQILRIDTHQVTRWARQWDQRRQRWIADTRISPDGNQWRVTTAIGSGRRRPRGPDRRSGGRPRPPAEPSEFLTQVEYVARQDAGEGCAIDRRHRDGLDYLIVVRPSAPLRCVGVLDGRLTADVLDRFDKLVFDPLRERGADLVLVHHGPQEADIRLAAKERGIRVKSWLEFNDLLDLGPYRTWLRRELNTDRLYPQGLYLPQRFRDIDRFGKASGEVREDLVSHVYDGLLEEDGRFVLVLGEAGFGKSFLVRRLAYRILSNQRANITPVVIYLRDRDKRQTIGEMVSNVLIPSRTLFELDRFQHSLQAGTLALLIDGYDEFAVRVGYQNAAAQLATFIQAMQGRAKILLTTRPGHFRSRDEATSTLFQNLQSLHNGHVYDLEPFDASQQHTFLTRWFELDPATDAEPARQAKRWMAALSRVDNLPELARTPRMLSFMVQDLSLAEIEDAADTTTVTAAQLYQKLVDRWLAGEAGTIDPLDERAVPADHRQRLLEDLAFRLWQVGERDVTEETLQHLARTTINLPRAELTVDQAAQLIGGRTLLQAGERRWRFAHQSVWEFLLANYLAGRLRAGTDLDQFGEAELTGLTARFLRDLAPDEATAWLRRIAEDGR